MKEIRDNVRYIYTDSYCLGETDTFTIYLPGTPWDELSEASTTPEMVEYTGRMYEMSDECLNYIWNLIRYNVDEEKYNEILTEQRVWIAEKEAKAEADREEFGGGTFAPVIYNDTLATLTMERCEELIEYLK